MSSSTSETSGKISTALEIVCADFPYLSGLAAVVDIRLDRRIETAAATASGKILIGKKFYEELSLRDLAIILAHELLHLFRQTHSRSEGHHDSKLVNIADDFIINDIIREKLDYDWNTGTVLDIGLHWGEFKISLRSLPLKNAATEYSLEEMVVFLGERRRDKLPEKSWKTGAVPATYANDKTNISSLGSALAEAGLLPPDSRHSSDETGIWEDIELDILSAEMERRLFPDENPGALERRAAEIRELAKESAANGVLLEQLGQFFGHSTGYGSSSSYNTMLQDMLKGVYRTPWESALQRWLDSTAPGDRSWARPSRRGDFRTDVVLPGRKREGRILHLLLDTSGSMTWGLPRALGAIASFCEANHVDTVHLAQCDTEIRKDEYIPPSALQTAFEIGGYGGTVFDMAFAELGADPEIESIVVLTDGGVREPPEPPFEVLWAILGTYRPNFSYGTIININR